MRVLTDMCRGRAVFSPYRLNMRQRSARAREWVCVCGGWGGGGGEGGL